MSTERKVYFFRLDVLPDEDGSRPEFDIAGLLKDIDNLKFLKSSTKNSRYSNSTSGVVCAWPTPQKKRLQLGKVRRSNLPSVDSSGKREELPIGPDDGIVDVSHVMFFANNIVGAEFNFYAPRATALSSYCEDKFPSLPKFKLRPLLRTDVLNHLKDFDRLTMLSVKVKPSEAALLKAAGDNFVDAISAAAGEHDAGTIEILMRADRRKNLAVAIFGTVRKMFGSSTNPSRDFEKFRVRGHSTTTDRTEEFDLLKDQIVYSVQTERMNERGRAVDSTKMFKAIEQAYNAHKGELNHAHALGLD